MDALQLANKWIHLMSMIGALGGIVFAAYVLAPDASTTDSDAESSRLKWRRWGIAQGIFWVLVLATGFANYAFIAPGVVARYHMLVGIKMMLAILMFVLALAIAHPAPALRSIAKNRSGVLMALILLGAIVVALSAYLNVGRVKRTLTKPVTAGATSGVTSPAEP